MKVVITGTTADNKATIAHHRIIPKEELEKLDSNSDGNPSVVMWRGRTPVQIPYRCESTEYTALQPAKFSLAKPDMPKAGEYQLSCALIPPGFEAPLHATDAADNIVILSGEVWLIMEDGTEVHLQAGDCVVQHGTSHGWHNRGSENCWLIAVVMGVENN